MSEMRLDLPTELLGFVTSSAPCGLHTYHAPGITYTEEHHYLPRGWQSFWRPPDVSSDLWDPRTIYLCRTSHGNVHYHLVNLMKKWQALGGPDLDTVVRACRADAQRLVIPFAYSEITVARTAMERWLAAGGSLADLCAKKLYGYI